MIRTYKFRLYPSEENRKKLGQTLELCRQIYNHFLEELNERDGVPPRTELQSQLPDLKNEWDELNSVHSKVLQIVLYRLYSNLKALSEKKKNGGKVGRLRYKGKGWFKTFTYNQSGFKIKDTSTRLSLLYLSKIGEIPIRVYREIEGEIKQVIIKRFSSGKWYAFVQADDGQPVPDKRPIQSAVGIDVGLTDYAVDSDGREIENPRHLKKSLKKLRREQRRLAKKEKGSNNYEKQRVKVARVYEHIRNQRDDYLHKLSRWYVDNYDLIATEELDIDDMMGDNKYRLQRNILDASWGHFNQYLSYKAENAGKTHIQVEPAGTTQRCSRCGTLVPKTLNERIHRCPDCGLELPRDYNASLNIRKDALSKVGMEQAELTPADIQTSMPDIVWCKSEWTKQEAPSARAG